MLKKVCEELYLQINQWNKGKNDKMTLRLCCKPRTSTKVSATCVARSYIGVFIAIVWATTITKETITITNVITTTTRVISTTVI
jgi:hypothetical protein